MTKLMTISTLAVVLFAAITTNADAFPRHRMSFTHGGAAALHHGAVVAWPERGHEWDPWGHWGAYYGPMI